MGTNMQGSIAFGLLAPSLRSRFAKLFGVASRKSIFTWNRSALSLAQVVVLDASCDPRLLKPPAPCTIWIGRECLSTGHSDAWVGSLPAHYTVSDLIDILDRAAVFLMDWRSARPTTEAESVGPAPQASATSSFDPDARFHLRSWIFLGPPFDCAGCVSALSLMARQPVTVQQLQVHSGLAPELLRDMMQELSRLRVLREDAPPPPSPLTGSAKRAAPVPNSLFVRLSLWLRRVSQP